MCFVVSKSLFFIINDIRGIHLAERKKEVYGSVIAIHAGVERERKNPLYRHMRGNCTISVSHVFSSPWNLGVKNAGSANMRVASIWCSGSVLTKGRLLLRVVASERRGLP